MILVDRESIKNITKELNISPIKSKGQNFLIDVEKAKNIVNLLKNDANSYVLEIGPGLGSLTYHLVNKCNNLTLVDVDPTIINYLKRYADSYTLLNEDALNLDLSKYDYIISNIPYSITTLLMEHILISGTNVKQYILMVQKENYAHFSDTKGKEYGPLSILIHLLGNIKKQFDVGPHSFYPTPKCISTVFTIEIENKYDRKEVINTYKLAVKLFSNRRKTILNNLSNVFGREKAALYLKNAGIEENKRPEEISPDQFFILNKIIVDEK